MSLISRLSAASRALFGNETGLGTMTEAQASGNEIRSYDTLQSMLQDIAGGLARSSSGIPVTTDSAESVTSFYRAIRLCTDTMSWLPISLYRLRADGSREEDRKDPIFALLHDRPNEWQTALEWKELKQRDVELRGNAYSYIARGFGGRPAELIRMHPDRVTPKQDAVTMAVTYEYVRPDGRRVVLRREDVLHIRGPGDDGISGRSVVRHHRESIGEALALREIGTRTFANGVRPSGILELEPNTTMGEPARKALREDFEELYGGVDNAGRTAIIPAGIKWKQVSLSMEDAQYIESRKFSVSEIARIVGVPPHKIGDLEKATFSNIEHQAIEFVQDAVIPRAARWEQAIKRDLLDGDPDRYAKYSVDALLRGDAKSRAEALQIWRRNGIINANEWRELEDMNPRADDGGNQYIIEGNMQANDGRDPQASQTADPSISQS